jgi:uncharacterized protein (DUF488 family)
VEVLVDVRSAPVSAHCPHFNRTALRPALQAAGIHYSYAGRFLGGRPPDPDLLRCDGGPDYDKIAADPSYRNGLQRLVALAHLRRVAVMCAEAVPERCHRHRLIARSLCAMGVDVRHIMRDGSVQAPAQPWLLDADGDVP